MIQKYFKIFLLCCFTTTSIAQVQDVNMFIFGHSLIDHRPPAIPTPSDETTVPHWLENIASQHGVDFAAGGQFGFLPSHANLPPISQLGYENVTGVWDSEYELFSETEINTIMMTAANFIQFTPADQAHPIDYSTTTVDATIEIMDWVAQQRGDEVRYYIYANWPEMDLQNAFPPNIPSEQEVAAYHELTHSSFIDWWLHYQDVVLERRPQSEIRLIPVGPIMSGLITGVLSDQVPFDHWYEDSAPHGRPNLYFLASLITHMSIYEEPVDSSIEIDSQIHPAIRNNITSIIDYIWSELQIFNFTDGESRVFFDATVNSDTQFDRLKSLTISPNPAQNFIKVEGIEGNVSFEILSNQGVLVSAGQTNSLIDLSNLNPGFYLLKITTQESYSHVVKMIKL